jgi:hypothetical protein
MQESLVKLALELVHKPLAQETLVQEPLVQAPLMQELVLPSQSENKPVVGFKL